MAILRKPKQIKQYLDMNKQTFDLVIERLKKDKPDQPIDYTSIRQFVDNGGGKENQNPYRDLLEQTYIPPDKQTSCQQSAQLISSLSHSTPESAERSSKKTKQQLLEKIRSLEEDKRLQAEENERLSRALTTATLALEARQITPVLTRNTQKEKPPTIKLTPYPPIDHVSSKYSTPVQQKIDKIKNAYLDNSFAQDWVIEYFVTQYTNETAEELIEKLKETEKEMVEWKHTLVNKNFIDNWILKLFIVYYSNDYENRYEEAQKAYTDFFMRFGLIQGFTTTDTLKKIVLHYYQHRDQAIETGIRLYSELFEKFSKKKLVNSNPSVINRYIIRNFNNPEEDLKKACKDFDTLLKNATKNPDSFFHGAQKFEFSPEKYLRLLFENYPANTINSIPKIEEAYQVLKSQFENDDFFEEYKTLALKICAITSTEKPVLRYTKLKKKLSEIVDFHNKYGLKRIDVLGTYLTHPDYAFSLIALKLPIELREKYKKEVRMKNFDLKI